MVALNNYNGHDDIPRNTPEENKNDAGLFLLETAVRAIVLASNTKEYNCLPRHELMIKARRDAMEALASMIMMMKDTSVLNQEISDMGLEEIVNVMRRVIEKDIMRDCDDFSA